MAELLQEKHECKELQDYFNSNKDIKKSPKKFAELSLRNQYLTKLNEFLTNYNCTDSTKEKIRVYLGSLGMSNLA